MFRGTIEIARGYALGELHPLLKDTGDFTQDEVDEQGDEQQRAHAAQMMSLRRLRTPASMASLDAAATMIHPLGRAV